jgi:nitrile hydratase
VSELTPEQRAEILERHLHDHGHLEPEAIDDAAAGAEHEAGEGPSTALGARIVARAWVDADFRQRLLNDAISTVAEYHPQTVPLTVLEDTPTVHHVIVCTLCSCYPRTVLGLPPDWYKSRNYRSRVVVEPRAVLKEFGTELPNSVVLRTHDSNADMRYLVLPERPVGTEGWSAEQLAAIVTRDCMVGVAFPKAG